MGERGRHVKGPAPTKRGGLQMRRPRCGYRGRDDEVKGYFVARSTKAAMLLCNATRLSSCRYIMCPAS